MSLESLIHVQAYRPSNKRPATYDGCFEALLINHSCINVKKTGQTDRVTDRRTDRHHTCLLYTSDAADE